MKINTAAFPQSVDAITVSPELDGLQYLMPMGTEDRERLKADIQTAGEVRDAVKCYTDPDTGNLLLLAGYNRLTIAKELGLALIPVQIVQGTPDEYRQLVIADNLNRRHLTADQKRAVIDYMLKRNPKKSNRQIAKDTGADHKTVKARRETLAGTGEIPQLTHTQGADGKTRPAVKKIQPKFKEEKTLSIIIDKNTTMNQRAQYINQALIICLSGLKGGEVNKLQSYIKSLLK